MKPFKVTFCHFHFKSWNKFHFHLFHGLCSGHHCCLYHDQHCPNCHCIISQHGVLTTCTWKVKLSTILVTCVFYLQTWLLTESWNTAVHASLMADTLDCWPRNTTWSRVWFHHRAELKNGINFCLASMSAQEAVLGKLNCLHDVTITTHQLLLIYKYGCIFKG